MIENLIMNIFLFISRNSITEVRALGFDASTVFVEQMPLGFEGSVNERLNRKN
jgi:hypothetical protein